MPYLEVLANWRSSREPALIPLLAAEADVAARASKAAQNRVADADKFHAFWMSVAESADPSDAPWLVATLTRKVDLEMVKYLGPKGKAAIAMWHERTTALLVHAPNPLLTVAGLRVLRADWLPSPYLDHADAVRNDLDARARAFFADILALLRGGADRGLRDDIAATVHSLALNTMPTRPFTEHVASELQALLASLPDDHDGSPTTATSALVATAASGLGTSLRDAVTENPDDDGARLVYADWLTEHQDPLGEFIVLQCRIAAGQGQPKDTVRVNALLRTYKDLWLGDVTRVLTHLEFKRGFLASCALAQNAVANEREWERLSESQSLRTVEAIAIGQGNRRHYSLFVESPEAVNLRVLHHVGAAQSRAVANGRPRKIDMLVAAKLPPPKLLEELFSSPNLPMLTCLVAECGVGAEAEMATQLATLAAHLDSKPIARLKRVHYTQNLGLNGHTALDVAKTLLALPAAVRRLHAVADGVTFEMHALESLSITSEGVHNPGIDALLHVFRAHGWSRVTVTMPEGDEHHAARAAIMASFPDATFTV